MKYYQEYMEDCKASDAPLPLYDRHPDIGLNEFDKFDEFLFTPEEMNDPLKFRKFVYPVYGDKYWEFMAPIDKPCTIEEHQINHYAMWNAMACVPEHTKPIAVSSFNSSINLKISIIAPLHMCYCCDFTVNYMNKDNRFGYGDKDCAYCPIWGLSKEKRDELFEQGAEGQKEIFMDAPCEDNNRGTNLYEEWGWSNGPKRGKAASDLAKVEWKYDILEPIEDDE